MSNSTKKVLIGILIFLVILVAGWLIYQNSASANSPRGDKGGGAKTQTGSLQGRLIWSDGSPVVSGTVYVYQNNSSYPLHSVAVSNGSYQIVNLATGTYDVRAITFDNGRALTEHRHDVVITKRQAITIDFNFMKVLVGSFTGTVKWADGTPVMAGQVEIWDSKNGLDYYNKVYISYGKYNIENVPVGTYDIKATTFDPRQSQLRHGIAVSGGQASLVQFVFKK